MKHLFASFLIAFLFLTQIFAAEPQIKLRTIVLDAGHGGNDPGAVSGDRKTYESTLTLDISKRFGEKISTEFPDVKVVYSRPANSFVSLNARAAKANSADADLFISIHINASVNTKANGYSVHILGQSSVKDRDLFAYNMDVCKRENSVILLEDDYSTKYQGFDPNNPESFIFMQLMQNSNLEQSLELAGTISNSLSKGPIKANRGIWQNPFYVLWKTAMPSVLVELGFISNKSDLEILRSEAKRDEIANCLLDAFRSYKASYEGLSETDHNFVQQNSEQEVVSEETAPSVRYGTQIFAGSRLLPEGDPAFKGFKPEIIKVGRIYKYVVGVSNDMNTAVENYREIVKKFNGAFMVKLTENGLEIFNF